MNDFIPWRQFLQGATSTPSKMSVDQVVEVMNTVRDRIHGHPLLGMISAAGFNESFQECMHQLRPGILEGGYLLVEWNTGYVRLEFLLCQGHAVSASFNMDCGTGLIIENAPLEDLVKNEMRLRGEELQPDALVSWRTKSFSANATQLGLVDAMMPLVGQAISEQVALIIEADLPHTATPLMAKRRAL